MATTQPMRSSMLLAVRWWPWATNGRSKWAASPTPTGQSSRPVAPTSMKCLLKGWMDERSSLRSAPMTPSVPSAKRTRPPINVCGPTPPMLVKRRKPCAVMWVAITPISSMWAATITLSGFSAAPRLRMMRLPIASTDTSSACGSTSGRIRSRTPSSNPDGPKASTRERIKSFMVCLMQRVTTDYTDFTDYES